MPMWIRPSAMRLALVLSVLAGLVTLPAGARMLQVTAGDPGALAQALSTARARDTLLVAPGRYRGGVTIPDGVIVIAVAGPDSTVIDGEGKGPVVLFEQVSGATLLEGFTVTGGLLSGAEEDGAGVLCIRDASPRLNHNRIVGNRALGEDARGGGIACLDGSNPVIANSVIRDNESAIGGGIYIGKRRGWVSAPVVSANRILMNRARREGGGVAVTHGSEPVISMNVIAGNRAGRGGGGLSIDRGQPRIEENVVWGNADSSGVAAGILLMNYAAPRVERNIIARNEGGPGVSCDEQLQEWQEFRCNDVWGHEGGDFGSGCAVYPGNLSADPRFCDPEGGDFRLRADSPCLAAPGCERLGPSGLGCSVEGLAEPGASRATPGSRP